jgi:CheY-like chemotaxis protein
MTPTILLIEDDLDQAELIGGWLRRHGWAVTTALSGARGVQLVDQGGWDLILCDLTLPDLSGVELLARARAVTPGVLFVLMTANVSLRTTLEALQHQADHFIPKPLHRDTLLHQLGVLLHRRAHLQTTARPTTVLAVGVRREEVDLGCGGALLDHLAQGHRVVVLALAEGADPGEPSLPATYRASDRMGGELLLGGLSPEALSRGGETADALLRVVRQLSPDVVYTVSGHDLQASRTAVYAATLAATRRVPKVLAYQGPSSALTFQPTLFTELSSALSAKLRVLDAYRDGRTAPHLAPAAVEATARYWGRFAGYRPAEAFEVVQDHAEAAARAAPEVPEIRRLRTPRPAHRALSEVR